MRVFAEQMQHPIAIVTGPISLHLHVQAFDWAAMRFVTCILCRIITMSDSEDLDWLSCRSFQ
jgi:hypothetical protein